MFQCHCAAYQSHSYLPACWSATTHGLQWHSCKCDLYASETHIGVIIPETRSNERWCSAPHQPQLQRTGADTPFTAYRNGRTLGGAETAAVSIHGHLISAACGALSAHGSYNNKRRYTSLGHTVCNQGISNSLHCAVGWAQTRDRGTRPRSRPRSSGRRLGPRSEVRGLNNGVSDRPEVPFSRVGNANVFISCLLTCEGSASA
jgi:hypothetical protein